MKNFPYFICKTEKKKFSKFPYSSDVCRKRLPIATVCLLTHFASNICGYLNLAPKADWHIVMNLLFPFRGRERERSHNNKLFPGRDSKPTHTI